MRGTLPLEIENLSYGSREPVFENASFSVSPGEFVTVLVQQTASQSAFLDCLSGNLKPTTGKILFWGRDNRGLHRESINQRVGWIVSKKESYAPWIRLGEYLQASSRLQKTWNQKWSQQLVQTLGLDLNRRMSDLTEVQLSQMRLVRALSFEPGLLVMGEFSPTIPAETKQSLMESILGQFGLGEMAVLYVGQSAQESLAHSDRVIKIGRRNWTTADATL